MHNEKLIKSILQASAIIDSSSRSGSGNYITVSEAIANALKTFRVRYRKEKIIRIFNEKI